MYGKKTKTSFFLYTDRPQIFGVTIGLLPHCFPTFSVRWKIFHYTALITSSYVSLLFLLNISVCGVPAKLL